MRVPPAQAVLLMGLSGSGKGTQALKLEQQYGFVHIESSKIIEDAFAANAGDPVIEHERVRKAAGDIVAPELVARWMASAIRSRAASGESIVFSGSPRTVHEAQTQLPLLEELYGQPNVRVFHLAISRQLAAQRSLARRVCVANQHPVADGSDVRHIVCPECGSPLMVREDDSDPAKVVFRQAKFEEQTAPVLDYLRDRGYAIVELPADGDMWEIHTRIWQHLGFSW